MRSWSPRVFLACWLSLACSSGTKSAKPTPVAAPFGSVAIGLDIPGGQSVSTLDYQLTGPGAFTRSGVIDAATEAGMSAVLAPLPVGGGYRLAVTGTASPGAVACSGTAGFDVLAQATTNLIVHVACDAPGRDSDGCPVLDGVSATPAEVAVGSTISLAASVHGGPSAPAPRWSAPTGTFSGASTWTPTFTCTAGGPVTVSVSAGDASTGCAASSSVTVLCTDAPLQADVQNIVIIYAENRSFDGLFGDFPGARGVGEVVDAAGTPSAAYRPQLDRDGTTVLPKLPQTWGGATAAGNPTVVTQAQTDDMPNAPFPLETGYGVHNPGAPDLTARDVTRDIAHRFFENIMAINGGTNDLFAAWEDGGGITMGHWTSGSQRLAALAKQFVLADNFFEGAFGGSFLNHQYLICACAPVVPAAYVTSNNPSLNVLGAPNAKGVPQLAVTATSPDSALTGPPSFQTGNLAPLDYFGSGDGYRAVNTMQPPYQPSGNPPAAGAADLTHADPAAATTLPPQTQATIGDLLTARGVDWAWYAGSWDAAVADGTRPAGAGRSVIYAPGGPRATPNFQAHHQPYNYFARFDPTTRAAERAFHLKDENQLIDDAAAGTLPPVAWTKPAGGLNQHPGYANIDDADAHIADLIAKLQAGPQWPHMVIVVTYDEYGGQWDHVAPPAGDRLGPGTRIPAIVVSPFANRGTVDHTQADSASTLRLITRRWALPVLPGLAARDAALVAGGNPPMGDLTSALSFP